MNEALEVVMSSKLLKFLLSQTRRFVRICNIIYVFIYKYIHDKFYFARDVFNFPDLFSYCATLVPQAITISWHAYNRNQFHPVNLFNYIYTIMAWVKAFDWL